MLDPQWQAWFSIIGLSLMTIHSDTIVSSVNGNERNCHFANRFSLLAVTSCFEATPPDQ